VGGRSTPRRSRRRSPAPPGPPLPALPAREALTFVPPAPLLLRLRPSRVVDLKLHGLVPIAFLARCHALEAGSPARGTIERLDAARRAGALGEGSHAALVDAHRFLLSLRIQLQLRALSGRAQPSNRVALADLAPTERHLRQAFGAIGRGRSARPITSSSPADSRRGGIFARCARLTPSRFA
jgi:signal-transduction protein with cAMP-binding, CBS, and nucleotidyltransferase domain